MAVLKLTDADIYFEDYGKGFPVLLFGPGGMRSRIEMWRKPPDGPPRVWSDWIEVLSPKYRVIAMDQRNAGRSRGAIEANHDWNTYGRDQLALLDHLGVKECHTLGGCIGSSFCLKLIELAPGRTRAAVLQNPIGLNPEAPAYFPDGFVEWTEEQVKERPTLDRKAMTSFGQRLWSGDFVFSVPRNFVKHCSTPCLVLPGNDKAHPAVVGLEVAELLPNEETVREWKGPDHIEAQRRAVLDFLAKHTP